MNHVIPLWHGNGSSTGESEYILDIIYSNNIITPKFQSMSEDRQFLIHGLSWLNAAIFTYFRCIVYKYIFKQFKMKQVTQVNILTMVVCFFQHLEVIWGLMTQVLFLWLGKDYTNLMTSWFCIINSIAVNWFWGYSVLGGLGIAIYRIMLIKHQVLVKDIIGRKTLTCIILCCQFLILAFFTVLIIVFDYLWNPLRPPCMYLTDRNTLESIDTYRQSSGNTPFLPYHTVLSVSRFVLCISFELAEIIIYIIFFHHMYKHDNNDRLRKLLGNEIINQRMERNAMSFASLFFSFLVEALFLTMMFISRIFLSNTSLFIVSLNLRKCTLSVIAIVEVLTSCELRPMLFKSAKI